jgi:hypothetical protein
MIKNIKGEIMQDDLDTVVKKFLMEQSNIFFKRPKNPNDVIEKALGYIQNIKTEIWNESTRTIKRALTIEELCCIWIITARNNYPVAVMGSHFGSYFCFKIYNYDPPFPGVPITNEDFILLIDFFHIPIKDIEKYTYSERHYIVWHVCKPYFDTKKNKEMLEVCDLPKIGKRDDYYY